MTVAPLGPSNSSSGRSGGGSSSRGQNKTAADGARFLTIKRGQCIHTLQNQQHHDSLLCRDLTLNIKGEKASIHYAQMDRLPNELMCDIAVHLDRSEFLALYSSSKQMRKALSPLLWRQFTLGTCAKPGVVELNSSNSIPLEPSRYGRRICLGSKQHVRGCMRAMDQFPDLYKDVLPSVRLFSLAVTSDEHPSSPPRDVSLATLYHELLYKLELPCLEDIEVDLYADEYECQLMAELCFNKWPHVSTKLSLGLRKGPDHNIPSPPGSPTMELTPLRLPPVPSIHELRIYYMSIADILAVLGGTLPASLQKLTITQMVTTTELRRLHLGRCPQLTHVYICESLTLTDSNWIPPSVISLQYKEGSPAVPEEIEPQLKVTEIPHVRALKIQLSTGHSLQYMKFTALTDLELEEGPWSSDGDAVQRATANMIIPNIPTISTLRFHDINYSAIYRLVESAQDAPISNLIILGCRDSPEYDSHTASISKLLPGLRSLVLDLPDRRRTTPNAENRADVAAVAAAAAANDTGAADNARAADDDDDAERVFLNARDARDAARVAIENGPVDADGDLEMEQAPAAGAGVPPPPPLAPLRREPQDRNRNEHVQEAEAANRRHDHNDVLEHDFARFLYAFFINCPQLTAIWGVAWPDCFLPKRHRFFGGDKSPEILYGVSMRKISVRNVMREVELGKRADEMDEADTA